jgi:hypothetical protein
MEISQETPVGVRTYRYSLNGWAWNLVHGAMFGAIGCILLMRDFDNAQSDHLLFWAISIGIFLVAAYFVISAAYSVVFFDQESVTVRGVFFTQSIRRRSVSSYLIDPGSRNQAAAIRLISNSPGEMNLDVPKVYAFDDAWKQWISSLTDRTRQQEEEEEARFTLKR